MDNICLTVGNLQTNCYLVVDKKTKETIIIDPGDEADFITTTILEHKLIPKAILLTHGHYDHCLGTLELKLNFNLPIYLHQDDLFLYQKAHLSAKHFSKINTPQLPSIDFYLTVNQIITFGDSSVQTLHTPGHTPGSCCFISKNHEQKVSKSLFTGDTLFASGPGKADHKYSSKSDLQKSLKNIYSFLQKTLIYPGHEDYKIPYNPYESFNP